MGAPFPAPTADRIADAFLRLPEVIRRTGLSSATIYRKMAAGTFPSQVQLSANIVAWRESDIARWMSCPGDWRAAA